MSKNLERDERVLLLRDQGRSFEDIAQIMELDSAFAANTAFNRALRRRSVDEQAQLRSREATRLDAFATRLRGRSDLSVEEVVRRLRGLQHVRKTLFEA